MKGVGTRPPAEEEKGMTVAQMRAMQFEFLGSLQGMSNQFGGNLLPQNIAQTDLLREQNQILKTLTSGVSQPGARYARTELSAAFVGVGF